MSFVNFPRGSILCLYLYTPIILLSMSMRISLVPMHSFLTDRFNNRFDINNILKHGSNCIIRESMKKLKNKTGFDIILIGQIQFLRSIIELEQIMQYLKSLLSRIIHVIEQVLCHLIYFSSTLRIGLTRRAARPYPVFFYVCNFFFSWGTCPHAAPRAYYRIQVLYPKIIE